MHSAFQCTQNLECPIETNKNTENENTENTNLLCGMVFTGNCLIILIVFNIWWKSSQQTRERMYSNTMYMNSDMVINARPIAIGDINTKSMWKYRLEYMDLFYKNIERHTADTIVSWPNPKQWAIVHTSDLMMIIRQSIYILSIITREMGKLK